MDVQCISKGTVCSVSILCGFNVVFLSVILSLNQLTAEQLKAVSPFARSVVDAMERKGQDIEVKF